MKSIKNKNTSKPVGLIRIMLGMIFIMTGFMKIALPDYGDAWSIQLVEAEIPLYSFTYYFVPLFEVILGLFLFFGWYSRLAALMIFPIMIVAVYVHLTVSNPGAFPSQPQEPYMPIAVMMMAFVIVLKGSGSWRWDFLNSQVKIK
jgi:putative oxidoreductase